MGYIKDDWIIDLDRKEEIKRKLRKKQRLVEDNPHPKKRITIED